MCSVRPYSVLELCSVRPQMLQFGLTLSLNCTSGSYLYCRFIFKLIKVEMCLKEIVFCVRLWKIQEGKIYVEPRRMRIAAV